MAIKKGEAAEVQITLQRSSYFILKCAQLERERMEQISDPSPMPTPTPTAREVIIFQIKSSMDITGYTVLTFPRATFSEVMANQVLLHSTASTI
jgi:hypothetical protein